MTDPQGEAWLARERVLVIVLGRAILAVTLALVDIWQRRMALGETG